MPSLRGDSQIREYARLLVFIAFLSCLLGVIVPSDRAARRDFICYWASAQLLLHGQNPYSASAVLPVERSAGYTADEAEVLRNPPVALPWIAPLGAMNTRTANMLWIFTVVTSIVLSLHLIRTLHDDATDHVHLLGYAFAPTLICIAAGQIVAVVLLALVLFLVLYRVRPFLAGVALSVCAIKPHLLLPFLTALGLWLVYEKNVRLGLGVLTGIAAASVIASLLRPSVWGEYLSMLHTARLASEFYPTPSALLRLAIYPRSAWLQLVPALFGCIWAAWHYLGNRNGWVWNGYNGYLLILVSLWVAPRSWATDELLALPALLLLFYEGRSRNTLRCLAAASIIAIIEMFAGVQITSPFYIWTTTAWLGCFLLALPPTERSTLVHDHESQTWLTAMK